jgi:hypothetical protein
MHDFDSQSRPRFLCVVHKRTRVWISATFEAKPLPFPQATMPSARVHYRVGCSRLDLGIYRKVKYVWGSAMSRNSRPTLSKPYAHQRLPRALETRAETAPIFPLKHQLTAILKRETWGNRLHRIILEIVEHHGPEGPSHTVAH